MNSERLPNRWGIAVAAVCMQICLGAAYGWSVFKNPLMNLEHWSETAVQLNFTLTFLAFGFGSIAGGLWQDRVGPRKVATAAGVLYGLGYIISGLGTSNHSLNTIYLGYGLISGFGMGMGYICPVATLVKWFPDKRGLMTGMAVCGFGFASTIMSPFAAWDIIQHGVPATFETLGIAYLLVLVVAAQFFSIPPQNWRPAGWQPRTSVAKAAGVHQFTLGEAAKTWQLYIFFLMQFIDVAAGFAVISQASPMAQDMVGMTVLRAAAMVGIVGLFNGLGRLTWAFISDHIGRAPVYFAIFFIEASMFFLLPRTHDWTVFAIAFAAIGFCYGGSFGTMPSFAADYYGAQYVGAIYGMILFVSNFGGAFGPIIFAHVHQQAGKYAPAIEMVTAMVAFAMILPLFLRKPTYTGSRTDAMAAVDAD